MIDHSTDLQNFCIAQEATIREAITVIDRSRRGITLVVDAQRRLVSTITDGDIRRAILRGLTLEMSVASVLEVRAATPPFTAPAGTDQATLLGMMREHTIRQIPLIDGEGRVSGLATLEELLPADSAPLQAVIMAGGFGKRLYPLTESLPKPMLPVGEKPVMELIINQLRDSGIHEVNVTTHFEPEKIKSYFGDGSTFGVNLHYVSEEQPLGTAGALSLMREKGEPMLVINGDILTEVDFRTFLAFHREHRADVTVAVRQYDFQVPYGVIESNGVEVTGVQEKPVLNFFVNAGIYLLEPSVHEHIPDGERFDMTDLIKRLLALGRPVANFPVVEYWLDIGQHADYQRAQDDVKSGKFNRS